MANVHYGNIGDIWKHLSLAEILAIEAPSAYWESHAGSSHYALTHTPERDFGIFTFARAASQSQRLNTAVYSQLLRGYERNGQLQLYPGSPLLAMRVLQPHHATFVFCDIDPESLSTISEDRATLDLALDAVHVIQGDGIGSLTHLLASVGSHEMGNTFVLLTQKLRSGTLSSSGQRKSVPHKHLLFPAQRVCSLNRFSGESIPLPPCHLLSYLITSIGAARKQGCFYTSV